MLIVNKDELLLLLSIDSFMAGRFKLKEIFKGGVRALIMIELLQTLSVSLLFNFNKNYSTWALQVWWNLTLLALILHPQHISSLYLRISFYYSSVSVVLLLLSILNLVRRIEYAHPAMTFVIEDDYADVFHLVSALVYYGSAAIMLSLLSFFSRPRLMLSAYILLTTAIIGTHLYYFQKFSTDHFDWKKVMDSFWNGLEPEAHQYIEQTYKCCGWSNATNGVCIENPFHVNCSVIFEQKLRTYAKWFYVSFGASVLVELLCFLLACVRFIILSFKFQFKNKELPSYITTE